MAKGKFIKGALWLTLTGAALRAVGMAYRVFISNKVGEEGMGLYQLILSVYMLGSAFAVAGVSIAVTRLVSDQTVTGGKQGVKKIMRFSLVWSMGIGAAVAAVLFVGAPVIATRFIKEPSAAAGIRLLAAGLPFMSASACFNGYFLGVARVGASCIAQIAEQAVRIGSVALLIQNASQPLSVIFFGNVLSEAAAAGLLLIFYRADISRLHNGGKNIGNIYARFLPIQLPIAAGKYISSALHTAENLLVPIELSKFTNRSDALRDFGSLKGMALPLIMFPSSFLSSLAGLLVPELATAAALRQSDKIKMLTRRALKVTFIFSIFMGGVFFRFAHPIAMMIYDSQSVANILKSLAPVIPFMYLDCITDGLLKGIGEQFASLRYSTCDSLMRISLVFLLLSRMGLSGFLLIMIISNASVALLGLRRLIRKTGCKAPWLQGVLLPLSAVALSHILSLYISSFWLAGVFYITVFVLFIFFSGALTLKELRLFLPRK